MALFYKVLKKTVLTLLVIIVIGYLLPYKVSSPVAPEKILKIDPESFWYYPWGETGVHKGIDIFCEPNSEVLAPVSGIVLQTGYGTISGYYLYMLGPGWRLYYFAHLDTVTVSGGHFLSRTEVIGRAGNTGNAVNKPIHLHFSIQTIFPYPWRYDRDIEGWKKMFYLDPLKEVYFDK